MQLELHPGAIADARGARLWYAERSSHAADQFMAELDRALERILESPKRWPKKAGVRRYVLRRYPFIVVYRTRESVVEIVAVAHARRRPGYWSSRSGS